MSEEFGLITSLIFFAAALVFVNSLMPAAWSFISDFSIGTFVTSVLGVAAFCTISTGIPCAVALGFSALLNSLGALLAALGLNNVPIISDLVLASSYSWFGSLILTPVSLILSLYIAKTAKGH